MAVENIWIRYSFVPKHGDSYEITIKFKFFFTYSIRIYFTKLPIQSCRRKDLDSVQGDPVARYIRDLLGDEILGEF